MILKSSFKRILSHKRVSRMVALLATRQRMNLFKILSIKIQWRILSRIRNTHTANTSPKMTDCFLTGCCCCSTSKLLLTGTSSL